MAHEAATRWYAPAYRAENGTVAVIGTQTVVKKYAEDEVKRLRSPEDAAEVFVATRLVYEWVQSGKGAL